MTDWVEYYRTADKLRFPSETLVRLLKGLYIEGMPKDLRGLKVLEVGCGSGNNMVMMNQLGMDVYGTEIDEEIVNKASLIPGDIRVGTNTNIGGPDNYFDFVVSWNVLHYETTEADIIKGIFEYRRVLKSGGRLILSTTGPQHPIRETAQRIGNLCHEITLDGDFRKGTIQCFFSQEDLHNYLSAAFINVRVGRTISHLFGHILDWWIVTAIKP